MKIQLTIALFLMAVATCFAQDQKVVFAKRIDAPAPRVQPRNMKPRPNDVSVPTGSLQSITNAVIQVTAPPNGDLSRRVTLLVKDLTGIYWISFVDGEGNTIGAPSAYTFGSGYPPGQTGAIWIQNGNLIEVVPVLGNLVYSVQVVHQNGSTIESLDALVTGFAPPTQGGPSFHVQSVGMTSNGQLFVTLSGALSSAATIGIGASGAIAVAFTPDNNGGGTALLSQSDTNGLEAGSTTITVCDQGVCGTDVFTVSLQPNSGKG